ncbi:hypothetical protein BGZ65_007578, partial [Modicella reniformis]
MSPRPVRAATKNVSYKLQVPNVKKKKRAGDKRDPQDSEDEDEDNNDDDDDVVEDDNDDSDEYVDERLKKDKDGADEDGDVDMDVDDDDVVEPISEEEEEEEEEDPQPIRRRRKTRSMNTFTLPLDSMDKFLGTSSGARAGAGTTLKTPSYLREAFKMKPTTMTTATGIPVPIVPNSKRGIRATRSKSNKRGELQTTHLFPDHWRHVYQAPTWDDVSHTSMQEEVLRKIVYPNIGCNANDFAMVSPPSTDNTTTCPKNNKDQQSNQARTTTTKAGPNDDDHGFVDADSSALSILDDHLPILTTTRIHSRGKDLDMSTMSAQYFESTSTTGINDTYIINAGFSVWAIDWCPLPSYNKDDADDDEDEEEEAGGENKNYVAIGGFPDTAENCNARDQLYPLGKQDAHPNIIQIWNMNCNTNDQ